MAETRTAASWRDTAMLSWFDALGFELAPDQIVEGAVDGGAERAEAAEGTEEDAAEGEAPHEIDYGRPEANDHERLARDRADVRSMTTADLDAIARIDRGITGRQRHDYIAARLAEALADGGVRVSLTARCDDTIVGYLMARADLGDFGRTEPVAVIDTLGVDPEYAHRGIGRALLSQLFANLGALRVERVETIVSQRRPGLARLPLRGRFRAVATAAVRAPPEEPCMSPARRRHGARSIAQRDRSRGGDEHRRARPGLRRRCLRCAVCTCR